MADLPQRAAVPRRAPAGRRGPAEYRSRGKRKPPAEAGGGVLFGLDEGGDGDWNVTVCVIRCRIYQFEGLRVFVSENI